MSQDWLSVQTNLCRCASPQCRSAGRRVQRGAAANGGPGPGPPSAGASCSERPGTGLGGGDDPGEERDAGRKMRKNRNRRRRWLSPKAPGPQGAVCRRRRKAWSMSDDLLLPLVFYTFYFSLCLLLSFHNMHLFYLVFSLSASLFLSLKVYLHHQSSKFSTGTVYICAE